MIEKIEDSRGSWKVKHNMLEVSIMAIIAATAILSRMCFFHNFKPCLSCVSSAERMDWA